MKKKNSNNIIFNYENGEFRLGEVDENETILYTKKTIDEINETFKRYKSQNFKMKDFFKMLYSKNI